VAPAQTDMPMMQLNRGQWSG